MRVSWLLPAVALAAVAASCGKGKYECSEETPCDFGEVCIEGFCVEAACATSAQCPMEQHCEGDRQCHTGCANDDDCYPGDTCVCDGDACGAGRVGTCETAGCEETSVDCDFKQFCNTATGECYDAGGQYCKACEPETEVADCGEGNVCFAGYCGVNCTGGRECPSGFECYGFVDEFGNVVTYQCVTYCWLYENNGNGRNGVVAPPKQQAPLPIDTDLRQSLPASAEAP